MKLHFITRQLKQQEFGKTRHLSTFPKKDKAGMGHPRKTHGSSPAEFQVSIGKSQKCQRAKAAKTHQTLADAARHPVKTLIGSFGIKG